MQCRLRENDKNLSEDAYLNKESDITGNEENFNMIRNLNSGNNIHHRKNSTDFSYPFNFVNDNSLFLNVAWNFFKKPMEEKEFKIIFDNSFKYQTKDKYEEDSASEIVFLDRVNSSSHTKSNYNESRKNSSEDDIYGYTLKNNKDIIDEFLDCS